jgi:hypothetical protein
MLRPLGREVTRSRFLRLLAIVLLISAAIGFLAFASTSRKAAGYDFISYWSSGHRLLQGLDPYDPAGVFRLEHSVGYVGIRPNVMLNPPIAFILVAGLGLTTPRIGDILWMALLVVSLMASVRVLWNLNGRPESRVHLVSYSFAPVAACLIAGQLGIFMLLGIALFLYLEKTRPILAGMCLFPCLLKPHLFLAFGLVFILYCLHARGWRLLLGVSATVCTACIFSACLDAHGWTQYFHMMKATDEIQREFIPTVSTMFRFLVDKNEAWLQFVPALASCCWAVPFYWRRRKGWQWSQDGLVLLLVSLLFAPHAWFTDEAIVLPALLNSLVKAQAAGKSLTPFLVLSAIALAEVFFSVPLASAYYIWTMPAWFAWYLYATHESRSPALVCA